MNKVALWELADGTPAPDPAPLPQPALAPLYRALLDDLDAGRPPSAARSCRDEIRCLELIDRAYHAARVGRPQALEAPPHSDSGDGTQVHETAEVEPGASVGANTRIWRWCHLRRGAHVGRNCSLGQGVYVAETAHVGDGCRLQNGVWIWDGVTLEENVFCGPGVVFTNVRTPRAHVPHRGAYEVTGVGRGATIGANATIVCPRRIGPYAMVGAGAVVTHDVASYRLVVGNPARPVGWVCRCGERLPEPAPDARCGACGELYQLEEGAGSLVRVEGRRGDSEVSTSVPFFDVVRQHEAIREALRATAGAVLDSGQYIGGPTVESFERAFADYHGGGHAVGMSSGTDARCWRR